MKVLVTGGCGYIGSHTIVDLIEKGHEVICVDSNIRSNCAVHESIKSITGKDVPHYTVDLLDSASLEDVFKKNQTIDAIFHFAALKSVRESIEQPITYYRNNINGLLNLLKCVTNFGVPSFVFSSSCTVYGNPDKIPVTEETPFKQPTCPYGATKQMCEQILQDYIASSKGTRRACILRYFNPAGAHPSLLIGENPTFGIPSLTSAIVVAAKANKPISIFGCDYATKDRTCVRDFIHVCDIAKAHTLALEYIMKHPEKAVSVFNLGAGEPRSVYEAIQAFTHANSKSIDYQFMPRRNGDVEAIYANCEKAHKELGWKPTFTLEEILRTAYEYECIRN